MAFWGIEVKPGTPYVHEYDDENGRLHISQATIVPGSSNKRTVVQCAVGDKKPIYLCSLLPEKIETCPLNLDFEEEDEVTFSVIGPNSVHLSGFYYGEEEEEEEEQGDPCCDGDAHYEYGEDVMTSDTEDESDSGFEFDDEDDVEDDVGFNVPNSGVRIEEIIDDEKPANEDNAKQAKKKKSKNENSNSQIVVKSGSDDVPVVESEDEDGLPTSKHANKSDSSKPDSRTEEKKDASVGINKAEKKEKEADSLRKLKRKLGAVVQDEEPTRDNDEPRDSSVQPESTNPQTETKQKKKNKKKKVDEKEVNVTNPDGIGNSPAATNDLKPSSDIKKENKKKNKQEESVATPNTEEKSSKKEKKEKTNAKAMQVRTFPNGLMIEELSMGKPDGKKASKGKKIGVRYIGRLKKNDKEFDRCTGEEPFIFRLGVGDVISGWDVGVEGMRVGDKRRITIPPTMGYGEKGVPPAIPGNAWLVFDVELVEVLEMTNSKAMQVRTFPSGLMIEELSMGKPDGKIASKGKKIGVHYIGRLKKNDKEFDRCTRGKPFKFRLGAGEVISGWDVGVEGMRVGEKRRITIPPTMGYGRKGAPPDIPGNAWLVFDVELVEVN